MAKISRIKVGTASCGIAAGAKAVLDGLRAKAGDIPVDEVGCMGHCYTEPMVEVDLDDGGIVYYAAVELASARHYRVDSD